MLGKPSTIQSTKMHWLSRVLAGDALLVLLSQACVSGTNFLTSMIVGNVCGADGLGYYALGFSLLVFATGFQSALISIPYTVYFVGAKPSERVDRANSSFINHLMLVTVLASTLLVVAMYLHWSRAVLESQVAFGLAFAIPCFISREFVRRIHFADGNFGRALQVDLMTTLVQIALLFAFWIAGNLTATSALVCIGGGCLVAIGHFVVDRFRSFRWKSEKLAKHIGDDWRFGRWLVVEQLFNVASAYAMPWLLAWMVDQVSVGIFAACFAIAGLSNPFLQAIGSYSLPKFAKGVAAGDARIIKRDIYRISIMTIGIMVVFLGVCCLFGEYLLRLFFQSPEFAGYGLIVAVLSGRAVIGSLGLASHYYLLAIEKPKICLFASVASVAVMITIAILIIPVYGILGAAVSWLFGTLTESAIMIAGYVVYRPKSSEGGF